MDTIAEENFESSRHVEQNPDPNQSLAVPIATLFSSNDANLSMQAEPQTQTKFHIPDAIVSDEQSNMNAPTMVASTSSGGVGAYLTTNEAEKVNAILNNNTGQQEPSGDSNCLVRPSSKSLLGSLMSNAASTSQHYAVGCDHLNAGQELCYLCHQRQRRNVPVYLGEEVRRREKEEAQLLAQYQHLKDLDKQLKDDEKRNAQRQDRAKIDAFNLGMSEAVKSKQKERPKTCDVSRSFIFRKRCKTPPKYVKQQDLSDYLSKQIEARQREVNQNMQETKYLEKLEQLQLAEELAAQREAYLKDKHQRQKDLKSALDYQVKTRSEEVPRAQPNGEIFGEWDAKNEKLAHVKSLETAASRFNKQEAEQRNQELDAEHVERMREELRVDRAARHGRALAARQSLEAAWLLAARAKRARDLDERTHRLAHDGMLVHEQCDRYRRCAQCRRDLKNCGESNLWADVRYPAGNRIFV